MEFPKKKILIAFGLVIIIIIIIIVVATFNNNTKSDNSINKMFNDLSYKDNVPNGGFLISMLNLQDICSDFVSGKKNGKCADPCDTKLDIGNITKLVQKVKDDDTGTNCFSLDTTYFRNDLIPYAFGPYPGNPPTDLAVGLIIDHRILWEYIACMYIIDSGSIARYNTWKKHDNNGKFQYCDNKECWDKYLKDRNSKFLGFAGCGQMNYGLTQSASTFFANPPTRDVTIPTFKRLTSDYWSLSDSNFPYSRYNWKEWIEKVKQITPLTQNNTFINQQCTNNGNGYRENEVDIILPQVEENADSGICKTIPEFESLWPNAILGVFTNAKTNCSTKQKKDSCFRCKESVCCCTEEYAANLVKQLVANFNKKYNKNIKSYSINTLGISDFDSANHKLNIIEI